MTPMANQPVRVTISYAIVFIFLVSFLWAGVHNDWQGSLREGLTLGNFPPCFANHADQSFKRISTHV